MTSVYDTLRRRSQGIWDGLHSHPFVREMAAGTLPPRKFAFYIGQNILYLKDFARVHALGVAKAEDEATMCEFARGALSVIEFELPQNRELLAKVRLLDPSAGEATTMAPTNLAYTRHLLAVGYSGGAPEILAAVTPCTVSYGEIGREFAATAADHPVYGEWIRFFAGAEYWAVVEAALAQLERVCSHLGEREIERLSAIFATSSRLERAFWDMAYDEQTWPV
jgi:thiaminase/transcriptional activator TenA